jgi:hypothetical protein
MWHEDERGFFCKMRRESNEQREREKEQFHADIGQ